MKIIKTNFKKGLVKLRVEDNEDLWTLKKIINEGDEVSSETSRVIKKEDREGVRKKMFLKLIVSKCEFREATFTLKILGKIIEGPEEVPTGRHHSFNIDPGSIIKIKKESWNSYEKKTLISSEKKPIRVLVTILDSKEASHILINTKVKELFSHQAVLPRKDDKSYDKKVRDYYNEVIDQSSKAFKNHEAKHLIIAGPGFAPEELLKTMKSKNKELYSKSLKEHTNHTGMAGVKELIRNGIVKKVVKESEVTEEVNLINEFFEYINKGKKVKYGLKEVAEIAGSGAIKTLLISEGLITDLRKRKRFKEIEGIINMAEKNGANVEFIGTKHEEGKRFYRFGGIGSLLRYDL
jgi:protein pelota